MKNKIDIFPERMYHKIMIERIKKFICYHFHKSITRPIHGHYICLECGRKYKTPF